MSSSCSIAIVGGGLAGLAAANALKTFGMKAEAFEAAPALGEIGAAVNTSPQDRSLGKLAYQLITVVSAKGQERTLVRQEK